MDQQIVIADLQQFVFGEFIRRQTVQCCQYKVLFGIDIHYSFLDCFIDDVELGFHVLVYCFERPLDGVEFFFSTFFDFSKLVKQFAEQFLVFENSVFIGFLQDVSLLGNGQCLVFKSVIEDLQFFGKRQCLVLESLYDF